MTESILTIRIHATQIVSLCTSAEASSWPDYFILFILRNAGAKPSFSSYRYFYVLVLIHIASLFSLFSAVVIPLLNNLGFYYVVTIYSYFYLKAGRNIFHVSTFLSYRLSFSIPFWLHFIYWSTCLTVWPPTWTGFKFTAHKSSEYSQQISLFALNSWSQSLYTGDYGT